MENVQLLISNGANPRKKNGSGLGCLHFAAQGGSPLLIVPIVRMIVSFSNVRR
jgi:ankyrin repeat protein